MLWTVFSHGSSWIFMGCPSPSCFPDYSPASYNGSSLFKAASALTNSLVGSSSFPWQSHCDFDYLFLVTCKLCPPLVHQLPTKKPHLLFHLLPPSAVHHNNNIHLPWAQDYLLPSSAFLCNLLEPHQFNLLFHRIICRPQTSLRE